LGWDSGWKCSSGPVTSESSNLTLANRWRSMTPMARYCSKNGFSPRVITPQVTGTSMAIASNPAGMIKQHSFCKIVRFGFGFFVFTLRLSVR
jgi:hypothetical protein